MKACGCGHIRVVLLKIHSGLMVVRMEELLKTVRCCLPVVWMTTHVKPWQLMWNHYVLYLWKVKDNPGLHGLKRTWVYRILCTISSCMNSDYYFIGLSGPRENPYQIPSGPRTDVFLFLKQTPTRQKTNLMLAFRVCFGDRLCLVGTVCL